MKNKILLIFILLLFPFKVFSLNKAPIDITKMDISSLNDALNEGLITSELLVNIYLDRIEEYKDYNAIITINENALKEAKELDQERKDGKVRSMLHGIPIIVKDNIDVYGMPTTAGAKALSDNYPKEDAEVIKKLKEAGAIILAKSNMSEFAFMAGSSRSSYGTVKNAYNKDYSSYGSSGGSAVSVALNLAVAALGTDTNSSIRVPASASNLVGYRPTNGLISKDGVLPYDPERDTIGILTKNTKDSIIINNIISSTKIETSLKTLNNITIGVSEDFLKGDNKNNLPENKETYEEIYSLMIKALKLMEDNGAKIVYLDSYYTYKENSLVSSSYSGFLFCDSFNKYLKNTTGKIKSFEELTKSNKKVTDLSGYLSECNTTRTLDEKNKKKLTYEMYITKIYEDNNLDVIVYPTTKNKLLKVGSSGLINTSAHASSTISFPSISMPLGFDQDNLPYGIEFMSLKNEDNKLYSIVSIYEELNPVNNIAEPSLYSVDDEVNLLLERYHSNKRIFLRKYWRKKFKKYLSNYNENNNVILDASNLNKNYVKRIIIYRLIKIGIIVSIYGYLRRKILY